MGKIIDTHIHIIPGMNDGTVDSMIARNMF